jgi:hypothetical protein
MSAQDPMDKSEMRLTGLILTQSLLIGAAVGVYDAGIWLPGGESAGHYVNGITYAMGALAVQILAYYLFKMFFEEQMQDKVRVSELQRQRDYRFREQQFNYDQRRADMELRMQEMQLEKELHWIQQNPGQTPSHSNIGMQGLGIDTISSPPLVETRPLSMGLDSLIEQTPFGLESAPVIPRPRVPSSLDVRLKKDGTPDLRYKGDGSGN